MRWIVNLIASGGDYLVSLSPRARQRLVLVGLLLLATASGHKLYVSINELSKPRPSVSAEQLILPMESLFEQTKGEVNDYQTSQQKRQHHLDSLAETINPDLKPSAR